ncbi:MAG: homocysteine S-methyltransferase [Actinomycetota bacterium]
MDLRERFSQGLILDGGLATQLERHGADLRDALWSARLLLDDPALIRRVHREYFAAGADVAISASYQASFEGAARRGLGPSEAAALMRTSVTLAREAAGEHAATSGETPIVAASIGPYGAILADGSEYDGRYGLGVDELIQVHRPRIEVVLEAEPDLLAVETIPSGVEAEAIVALLADHPDARAWMSFSCRDDEHLHDGTRFADVTAMVAASPQVVAVGVNCTPPGYVGALLRSAGELPVPMIAYPNLGSTWDPGAKRWIAEGPRPDLGALAPTWRDAGATAIGGCCGTGPEDIAAIAAALGT